MAGGSIKCVWYQWCGSTAITGDTWGHWVDSATSATTSGESTCWVKWNTGGTTAVSDTSAWGGWVACSANLIKMPAIKPRELTAEEIAAKKQRDAEAAEKQRKADEERKAAEQRAADFLQQHLDDEQRRSLAKSKVFAVIGSDGERYEIDCTKRQHNVFEVKDGKRVREFCIVQSWQTPNADNHLAQKLLLESDAKEFHRIANKWDITPARRAAI